MLALPPAGLSGVSSLNQRKYIDVFFYPTDGQALDVATITDATPEFVLTGAAASAVSVDGAACRSMRTRSATRSPATSRPATSSSSSWTARWPTTAARG